MKKTLRVTLKVTEPSTVEIRLGETVQLDRTIESPRYGRIRERMSLLDRGSTRLELPVGEFHFNTLQDAQLRVVQGGVTAGTVTEDKDPWPDPPSSPLAASLGSEIEGDQPELTIE